MRNRLAFMASLAVAFAGLSMCADGGAPQNVISGTVKEWHEGQVITVARGEMDPWGIRFNLRGAVYEPDSGAIRPGVRVTVWYRSVGERHAVADKVRVLPEAYRR